MSRTPAPDSPPLQPGGEPVWIPEPPPVAPRRPLRRFLGLSVGRPMLAAALLAAAYPPLNAFPLAWFAFAPLLNDPRAGSRRAAAIRAFWAGLWFFLLSMVWLSRVTAGGLAVLAAALALLYWMPFGLFLHHWRAVSGFASARVNLLRALQGATLWAGLETLRAHLFTGFPWNTLAVSQVKWISLIQLADWGGAAVVSFLVMTANLAVASAWLRLRRAETEDRPRGPVELALPLALIALALVYGAVRIRGLAEEIDPEPPLRAVAVQTNIPQFEKWTEAFVEHNYEVLTGMTRRAALEHPDADLLLWPETAIPDDGSLGPIVRRWLADLGGRGAPILAGALLYEAEGTRVDWYNAAILVDTNGAFTARYDKQRLVMFGEYVPAVFKWLLPFLRKTTEIGDDVTAGTRPVVFPWRGRPHFSVMICFEDTLPDLCRRFVRDGARLLINQTNDAWFDPWWGSDQHLANSVLRAVENRVPLYRCANSGISGAVDIFGRVATRSPARQRGLFPVEALARRADAPPTVYTRVGDAFGFSCVILGLLSCLPGLRMMPAFSRAPVPPAAR